MYSKLSAPSSGMAASFLVTKSQISRCSFAPGDKSASRGEKRPSSFTRWETASFSKAAQQNSPVDTSQKATPPRLPASSTAQM